MPTSSGAYDNKGFRYRGRVYTDEKGRYRIRTIQPALYPGRTRHYHVNVAAGGKLLLTTQLYFPDEPGNRRDGLFRKELLMEIAERRRIAHGGAVRFRHRPAGMRRTVSMARRSQSSRASRFRCRGTSSTAMPARLPGGWPKPGPFAAMVCITRGGMVPAAIVARELGIRMIETVCVTSYDHTTPGRTAGAQDHRARGRAIGGGRGKGVLIVDDLVDTGKTARIVRDLLPEAHFATVYAKPMGRPMVDTFITEVSQDTWIYFPWDTGLAFQPPIREAGL